MARLLAFDTETGGTDPKENDLLTAYFCVLDDNLNILAELDMKLKPDEGQPNVTAEAMKVNGIDLEKHLADPETLPYKEGRKILLKFLAENLEDKKPKSLFPAGHNVGFDIDFINAKLINEKDWSKLVHYRVYDTMPVSSFLKLVGWWPERVGSLTSIVEYLGLQKRNAHTAKDDTLMFLDVLRSLKTLFRDKKANVTGIDPASIAALER